MALVHWDQTRPASESARLLCLARCLPAFCLVITYRLGAEEADGQDVNTPKNRCKQHFQRKQPQRSCCGKCGRTTWNVLQILEIPPAGAGIKLRVRDKSDKADIEFELRETEVPCWRSCRSLSPLSHPLLTFYPGALQKASCCHSGMLRYLAKKVKNLWVTSIKTIVKVRRQQ